MHDERYELTIAESKDVRLRDLKTGEIHEFSGPRALFDALGVLAEWRERDELNPGYVASWHPFRRAGLDKFGQPFCECGEPMNEPVHHKSHYGAWPPNGKTPQQWDDLVRQYRERTGQVDAFETTLERQDRLWAKEWKRQETEEHHHNQGEGSHS